MTYPTQREGGCQCRAVRFSITGPIVEPALCHCRMCQLAFGGYFAALGSVAVSDLSWHADRPTIFRSSRAAERGFCRTCGTPLTFQYDAEPGLISLALACLDDAAAVPPERQDGVEARLPWLHDLWQLPADTTENTTPAAVIAAIQANKSG